MWKSRLYFLPFWPFEISLCLRFLRWFCSWESNLQSTRDIRKHELRLTKLQVENLEARVEILKCELRSTKYELNFTELQVQIYELWVQIHQLRVQIQELKVQNHQLQVQINNFNNHLNKKKKKNPSSKQTQKFLIFQNPKP